MTARIRAAWLNLPLPARKVVIDFVETFVGMVVVLNLVVPGSLEEAKAQAVLIGGAAASAAISAGRRAWPGVKDWLRTTFVVTLAALRR